VKLKRVCTRTAALAICLDWEVVHLGFAVDARDGEGVHLGFGADAHGEKAVHL